MSRCMKSVVDYNTEALEKIVYEPEWVLANQEEYWSLYPAQKHTREWAEQVNYAIDYAAWRKTIEDWAGLPERKRRRHVFLRNTESILKGRDVFVERALPRLCSYLPDAASLDIGVHFTAFIPPRAFAMGEIVINVAATYWKNNPDNILSAMVHELFHVGYSYCEELRAQATEASAAYDILRSIHNEGACTYVAYMARDIFPAPDEKDFQYLDDPAAVDRHLAEVNRILGCVGAVTEEELQRMTWDIGVVGRSFYVAGAHMCRAVEAELGREALKKTLLEGPAFFVALYNEASESSRRITLG